MTNLDYVYSVSEFIFATKKCLRSVLRGPKFGP